MNEAEWLVSADPVQMLKFQRRKAKNRKLRLLACACCRRVVDMCVNVGLSALEIAERFADGQASRDEMKAARLALEPYIKAGAEYVPWSATDERAYNAALDVVSAVPGAYAYSVEVSIECSGPESVSIFGTPDQARLVAETHCCRAIRCTFGNPFHPVAVDPEWLTSTVVALARGIYDERAFDRLPILADALMDAGCENADVLTHCRSDGPHVRGCWVVDLVLGKE